MRFDNLAQATKRAHHFTSGNRHRLASVLRRVKPEGPGVAALNYGWLLSHDDGDRLADLCLLDRWAASINRHCDTHRIDGDLNARLCLLAFLSAQIADTRKL